MKQLLDKFEVTRKPYRSTFMWVGLMLSISWAAELFGRVATEIGYMTTSARDALGLVAVFTLCLASRHVLSRADRFRSVGVLLTAGVVLLVLFQVSDVLDEVAALQGIPLFTKNHPQHLIVEHLVLVTGTLLLALAFYLAVLDGDQAVRAMEAEHRLLLDNVRERERAERALLEAHDALEHQVHSRTAELAERNAQLQVELNERTRFEEAIARRLRYEEGLAHCSGVLLAGADMGDSFTPALEHLLHATQCSRVYFFENGYCTEAGPYAELTHEACARGGAAACPPTPGMRLVYNQGLHRWRESLAHGEPLIASRSNGIDCEYPAMDRYTVKSALLLPVVWEGRWRGFLGFDETAGERTWSPEEIRMLRTAAEMFGACKERERAEAALRKAYDDLERRVDDRTTDLSRANEQLSREVADRRRAEQEKRKLEQQLRQAQKMQAIGTLAGGIAHDFNNILASIIGYTELGLRRAEPATESNGGLSKYLTEVLKAANRARELVRQILIFSRQNDAERSPVYPHIVAQEVIALMRASCPANITVEKHLNPESGAVMGDPIQMHQVLLNLCTNAQHAMKRSGGVLDLSIEPIELDTEIQTSNGRLKVGEYVLITVADSGHGMDGQTLERIFEPFFTTKSVSEGTGMGLAIVHGIVVGQGGAITVQSTLERGTAFQVYLPRYQGPVPELISTKNDALSG
ncbi:MAG: GAF domain-containing protein, partial [Candidatus Hydrogenedentes bacterium]|nr:GAF domain-containing protein [Candidatus Hydrogenedentota bacterium]